MAVRVLVGDLFVSPVQTLVNAVNSVGVMGKGVALEFKRRYPAMYADYAASVIIDDKSYLVPIYSLLSV